MGMEDVKNPRCVLCARQPTYNLPGLRPSHCSDHVKPGMIRNPRVRCTQPDCKEWSTHGRTVPLRCESHALPTDTNLVERECLSCGLTMVLCGTGHCEFCDPAAARKRRRLAKQDEVKHHLAVHMPEHPPCSSGCCSAELQLLSKAMDLLKQIFRKISLTRLDSSCNSALQPPPAVRTHRE
jgi:hypothetical protein